MIDPFIGVVDELFFAHRVVRVILSQDDMLSDDVGNLVKLILKADFFSLSRKLDNSL
jgi:hypothetical protein